MVIAMNYNETLHYLLNTLPVYHKSGTKAYKGGLENAMAMDEYFDYPHRRFSCVHVAGTNGKGSVSHMLASVYREAGYTTGLFTSPHLVDFRERIRVNGVKIPEAFCSEFISEHKDFFDRLQPSFFELTVFLCFNYFSRQKVDIAIIETGLGGRLDTTNVITPVCSIITNIGLDHTNLLGTTMQQIAVEKAGIIKPRIPVIIGVRQPETEPVFRDVCQAKKSKMIIAADHYNASLSNSRLTVESNGNHRFSEIEFDLKGSYQEKNIPAVIQTIDVLQPSFAVTDQHIVNGLSHVTDHTGLMGRWQILGSAPAIICDVCHNADGVREAMGQLVQEKFDILHIVFGLVADKDVDAIVGLLPPVARYYFTRADIPRSLSENDLLVAAVRAGLKGDAYTSVSDAFHQAKKNASSGDIIFIGGSTFVVAELLQELPR